MSIYTTGTGKVLRNVHSEKSCEGPCPIHCPSDHPMKDFPTDWVGLRMYRICPCGNHHYDPDTDTSVPLTCNGCCGCCKPLYSNPQPPTAEQRYEALRGFQET